MGYFPSIFYLSIYPSVASRLFLWKSLVVTTWLDLKKHGATYSDSFLSDPLQSIHFNPLFLFPCPSQTGTSRPPHPDRSISHGIIYSTMSEEVDKPYHPPNIRTAY